MRRTPLTTTPRRQPVHSLLLSTLRAGDIDRLLRARCMRRVAGAGAQQQMRLASRCEPTEEAQHRLAFTGEKLFTAALLL